jgi:3-phosphoshikimate 1-carboxyvinyltransferase
MTKLFQIPGSKSIAQRALICAALCNEPTILKNLPQGNDVQNLIDALENLSNFSSLDLAHDKKLSEKKTNPAKIFVEHGGTPLRFLTSFLCQIPSTQTLDGSPRLRERPILPLIKALNKAGAKISEKFPLQIGEAQLAEEIEIDASASSQFLSSLMLSGKALGIKKIKIRGKKTSSAYLKLTIKVLADFGIKIREKSDYYEISGDYQSPRTYEIEPDWASAGYILGAALLTKSGGKIAGLPRKSLQPDSGILPVLEKMGLETREKNGFLEFSVVSRSAVTKFLQSPGKVNCENFPDSAQTLAILAAFCEGKTELTGLETLPFKECHRLEALQSELKKIGVETKISRDSITIYGRKSMFSSSALAYDKSLSKSGLKKNSAKIKTFHDHRMALALGMAQTVLPNLKIEQPSVVAKSFPNFWNEISKFKNSAKKMAIIGDPVEHSLTPLLNNSAFAELGINFVCEKCPVSREKIHEFLKNNPYEKLAITAPQKEVVADNFKLKAKKINSLRYDGKIRGKNTDIPGIREVLNGDLKNGQTVLILGAGDTATSVLEALKIYDLKIFVHNRTPEKAQNLAKKFGISAISDLMKIQPEILISALPFDCEPELVEKMWKTLETVFVVGYNGLKVPRILQKAREKKKKIWTGGDLLWAQWKLQFEFLFDLPAPLDGKNLLKSFTNLTK